MWPRCVCGLSLRPAMSSIIRRRSGLTVLVSLMESSFLIEADEHLDSQDGSSPSLPLSSHLATDLSALAPAQRAGAQRLRALAQSGGAGMSALAPLLGAERTYARRVPLLLFLQDQLRSERAQHRFNLAEKERELALVLRELAE